ncbi:ribonuclease P protein subunit p25-like protein isoform X1 [Pieris brassicae]|uniref:ribonuclease P protein subunit p25-like protein isoform X1 n=2 Tax=Pieris brassicae TaxID=7116 RepID=UPI001E66066C|nr:ribonuclease P protein subunit p25-like protein isoform X1 [Pieris brassicae]
MLYFTNSQKFHKKISGCNSRHIYQSQLALSLFQSKMENYSKGKNVEEQMERDKIPITNLPVDFLWMQVKGGSKMTNLLSHASGILEDKTTTTVVWSGAGVAISKVISCAEILKRKFSLKYQVTKLTFKSVEEYWEPKLDGLETIVVKRQIPVIHILLSSQEIEDTQQLGYQTLHGKTFWETNKSFIKQTQAQKPKKPFKHKTNISKTKITDN